MNWLFSKKLEEGKAGESIIARWFLSFGNVVVPVYEKIIDDGKGPQLLVGGKKFIAPDLLVMNSRVERWVEAKHKAAFTWHRKTSCWCTGIDRRHYRDYLQVAKLTHRPVWLLFLHEGGQAKDSPPNSPAGLFGNELSVLEKNIHHEHWNWGTSGMVYWAREEDKGPLLLIATLAEVYDKIGEEQAGYADACRRFKEEHEAMP